MIQDAMHDMPVCACGGCPESRAFEGLKFGIYHMFEVLPWGFRQPAMGITVFRTNQTCRMQVESPGFEDRPIELWAKKSRATHPNIIGCTPKHTHQSGIQKKDAPRTP